MTISRIIEGLAKVFPDKRISINADFHSFVDIDGNRKPMTSEFYLNIEGIPYKFQTFKALEEYADKLIKENRELMFSDFERGEWK